VVLVFIDRLWFVYCCTVFVFLNAIFMLVCLKRLLSFLIFGLQYENVAHFFVFAFILCLVDFLLFHLYFQICYECSGKLLGSTLPEDQLIFMITSC